MIVKECCKRDQEQQQKQQRQKRQQQIIHTQYSLGKKNHSQNQSC